MSEFVTTRENSKFTSLKKNQNFDQLYDYEESPKIQTNQISKLKGSQSMIGLLPKSVSNSYSTQYGEIPFTKNQSYKPFEYIFIKSKKGLGVVDNIDIKYFNNLK